MAKGIQRTILIGNLGSDPKVFGEGSSKVARVGLAVTEQWNDRSGASKEHTEWFRLVFFRRLADVVGDNLSKGDQIYVEASRRQVKWKDKGGNERMDYDYTVTKLEMLSGGGPRKSRDDSSQNKAGSGFDEDDFAGDGF